MNSHDIRTAFHAARASGLRAKEAAEAIGVSEGAAVAAHAGTHEAPLHATPLRNDWLGLLQALEACGPLMALTRNESVVHEKTGVYQKVSATGHVGLALGEDIDLRLFFAQWHAGFAVSEALTSPPDNERRPAVPEVLSPAVRSKEGRPMGTPSLQFFDRHGVAVHKIYVREQTDLGAWQAVIAQHTAAQPTREFVARAAPVAPSPAPEPDVAAFGNAWGAMSDTHQFFGLLKQFGLERQHSFRLVEGRFTQRLGKSALRDLLMEAAFDGTPIMVFVGSPGCIQIHTGAVRRIEPMELQGKAWLNVLDPGFNLHLREDLIAQVWVVEKPTADGVVTSVEAFDDRGELMAMFFGARKPGQSELPAWRRIVAQLRKPHVEAAV